jgi:hypothetical protein
MYSMADKFEFFVKNDKVNTYERLAVLMFIINAAVIGIFIYSSKTSFFQKIPGLLTIVAILATIFIFFSKNKNMKIRRISFMLAWSLLAFYWIINSDWKLSILTIILFYTYMVARRILKIRIDRNFVSYPSFPQRTIAWNNVSNVVLKDGLLTIDLSDNTLIQQMIEKQQLPVDEEEFNEFCNQQLKTSTNNRL